MEFNDDVLFVESFLAITIGIVVLFLGRRINNQVDLLRQLSIPEPVTGGLLLSILLALLFALSGIAIEFEMGFRDFLLFYFFSTIGINATMSDLLKGGRPLAILMVLTLGYMIVQNVSEGGATDISFTVPTTQLAAAAEVGISELFSVQRSSRT